MQVVVLGAGYAGITVARRLERRLSSSHSIMVVDERDTHLVQHHLHRVIREPSLASEIQRPLSELLDRATHRQATVQAVDPAARRVELDGEELRYDVGVVCLGAQTDDHGLPGVREYGMPLKRVRHARAIGSRFREVCGSSGRVVVGGGGTAGVQAAGELASVARERDADVDIVLLEQRETVVPSFPSRFQTAVHTELTDRGVTVRTDTAVTRATDTAIEVESGESIPTDQLVWTGGITGPDAMDGTRPRVQATLQLAERTFVAGDVARVVDENGSVAPASAQTAIAQATVAGANVETIVEDVAEDPGGFRPRLERYRHAPRGWVVSVGDAAVAQIGPTVLTGPAARTVKQAVGLGYLQANDRMSALVDTVSVHLP